MLDEPIHLKQHNPLWKDYFNQEQERIRTRLPLNKIAIQHIGSTAISGIYAKPIIDIMIGVASFPPAELIIHELLNLGYEALGEAGVPDRLYFRYRKEPSFNLHVVQLEGQHWRSNLAFRDYLQAHPQEAKRYEATKLEAVRSGISLLLEYSTAKSAIAAELVARALAWRQLSG
jgi:GrpB-like predicted nucleotidyltransferase (UPF0157 family)